MCTNDRKINSLLFKLKKKRKYNQNSGLVTECDLKFCFVLNNKDENVNNIKKM